MAQGESKEQRAELGLNSGARAGGRATRNRAGAKLKRVKERRQNHQRGPANRGARGTERRQDSRYLVQYAGVQKCCCHGDFTDSYVIYNTLGLMKLPQFLRGVK